MSAARLGATAPVTRNPVAGLANSVIVSTVRIARTIIAAVLLALWVPVSVHCTLEAVSGLELIGCCFGDQAEPHQDNDCADDGCEVVESGQYVTNQREVELVAPVILLSFNFFIPVDHESTYSAHFVHSPPAVPDELAACWQFVLRAAPSPRAPSLLS